LSIENTKKIIGHHGDKLPQAIVITGPTASGKSAVAVQLAKRISGEIVCADSMQIYKEMDIGTAKITQNEMSGIPHHMFDLIFPNQRYSAALYINNATLAMKKILSRGNIPIVCGGTGQYISALVEGIDYIPYQTDLKLRRVIELEYDDMGSEQFYHKLLEIDPNLSGLIHPNDKKRVLRAMEIYRLTGQSKTALNYQSKLKGPQFSFHGFCIDHDREILYRRIENRVDRMIQQGLADEVKYLITKYPDLSSTAQQAIGYKELIRHYQGDYSLSEAILSIKQATRNYAKRQLTWIRKNPNVVWIRNKDTDEVVNIITNTILDKNGTFV
jgi:tRNA dimethylallyltransferase